MSLGIKVGDPNADVNYHEDSKQSKQSLEKKKAILRNQIQTLKSLKSEINRKLSTSINKPENGPNFPQTNDLSELQLKKLPIGNFSVKNELFNFAGIQCIKCSKNEYIFHFTAKGKGNRTCIYSVQFFHVDGTGQLGKYIMPEFFSIESILKETPLDNITYAVHFVRNCKHYIDCYHNRMDQFLTLKKSLENVTNCEPVTIDLGYQCVNINMLGVYDVEADDNISITIYLVYDMKETRPQLIKLDSLRGAPLQKETEKGLKLYLRAFKKLSLIDALESIENEENSFFSWHKTEKYPSLLSVEDSEESSEESSEEFVPRKKMRLRRSLRRSEDESFIDNELTEKIKRKRKIKRKIPLSSGNIAVKDVEFKERPTKLRLKKSRSFKKKIPSVKTGRMNPKSSKANISKFLTKYNNLPESKDPNESEKEKSKEGNSSEVSRPSKKERATPTKEAVKLSQANSPDKNIELVGKIIQKKARRRDPVMEKIKEHETSLEGRILRSTTNTPTKTGSPNKTTPEKVASQKKSMIPKKTPMKKVAPPKKLVTPKKITPSKKLVSLKKAGSSKIIITPNTTKTKMKQTSLKFPVPNSSSTDTTETVKLDVKSKLLKSKVVTSTPMPLDRKHLKRPLEADLDLSEIKTNANLQISKLQVKSLVVLERVEKINPARKAVAKSGIKKPSQVRK